MQSVLRSHFQFAFYLEVVVLTARYLILKEIASSVLYRVDHRFCPPNAAMLRTKHLRCQLTRTEELQPFGHLKICKMLPFDQAVSETVLHLHLNLLRILVSECCSPLEK